MKIGLWGAGGIARVHARHFGRIAGVELAVFDLDPERSEAFSQATGAQVCFTEDEFLSINEAVIIALPTGAHFPCANAALEAGLHVLLEKPITKTLAEADELIALAKQSKGLLIPGHVARQFADFSRINGLVSQGSIGKPAAIRMRRGGKAPMGHGGWFRDIKQSGGVMLDLGIHDFDWLLWTFGPVQCVNSRSVRMGSSAKELEGDHALSTITFQSGAIAHLESTWMDPAGFRMSIEVCGSEGMVSWDTRDSAAMRWVVNDVVGSASPMAPDDDPFYKQALAFYKAISGQAPPAVTPEEARSALELALACIQSAETGATVYLS